MSRADDGCTLYVQSEVPLTTTASHSPASSPGGRPRSAGGRPRAAPPWASALLAGALPFGAVSLAAPKVSQACSMMDPGSARRDFWPAPTDDVPRNTTFHVFYPRVATEVPLGSDVSLRRQGGATVAVSVYEPAVGVLSVVPQSLLDQGARYELLDARDDQCATNPWTQCPLLAQPQVIATFTIGSRIDLEKPRFNGIGNLTEGGGQTCSSDACCGPFSGMALTFSWLAGNDDVNGQDLLYRVDGPGLAARYLRTTSTGGWQFCTGGVSVDTSFPAGTYTVHAEDWAGHVEANDAFITLPSYCPLKNPQPVPPSKDAGTDARPDAGVDARPDASVDARPDASVDARPDASDDRAIILNRGGCVCDLTSTGSASSFSESGLFGGLAALAALWRRRRR